MRAVGGWEPGRSAAPRTVPSGRRRGTGGSPQDLGCREGGAGGLSGAALELASPGPEAGLRGTEGALRPHALAACCAQFFVGFPLCFFLKKFFLLLLFCFHGVGLWVLLGRQGEGRTDGARSGGAWAAAFRRKAHCVGVGLGGQGAERCFPPCLFSGEQTAPYAGCGKGGGAQRAPLGFEQDCAPPSPSGWSASFSGRAYLLVTPDWAEKLLELGWGVAELLNGRDGAVRVSVAWIPPSSTTKEEEEVSARISSQSSCSGCDPPSSSLPRTP